MPVFSDQQISEINALIAEIEKSIKPKCEIGARDKAFLPALLKASKVKKAPLFFNCRREYSDVVVSFFVKEKGVAKNRFHMNNQSSVFVLK